LRLLDWEKTIARQYLYEEADARRLEQLKQSDDPEIAGLAAKIDREEVYHRMHAQMWFERLKDEPRFTAAVDELRPLLDAARDEHTGELTELWDEMTIVRRSQPAGTTW
jgi:1,2-phenylacetyl-CoA epoxidase catalytic subunit